MFKKKADQGLLDSLSKLEHRDYSAATNIESIYRRLSEGRDAFATMYDLNVDAVAQISQLDLEIQFYIKRLNEIAGSVAEATEQIHNSAVESTEVAGVVAARHEDLTTTIITVSEESNNVYQKIDTSQQSLTEIRKLSENTITISHKMNADMTQLSDIINNMNEVISSINAISSQTNLLSLNASIEAARAGEAGRGFAVVADEIRSLADETKNLTDNMGQFVASVQHAAEESSSSVEQAIKSLEEVNTRIKDVWALNEENQTHVAGITDSISNLAAVSEEISSSMNEIEANAAAIEEACAVLKDDTEKLQEVGDSCAKTIEPLPRVEAGVDSVLKHMGHMSVDPFYALNKKELSDYFDMAITAHTKWVERLGELIENRMIVPFQVDAAKCKFGHFYLSIETNVPEWKAMWKEIGDKHKALHHTGAQVIAAMFNDDYTKAESLYRDAENISKDLVSKLEHIKSMIPDSSSSDTAQ